MENVKDTVIEVGLFGACVAAMSLLATEMLVIGVFAEIVVMFRNIMSFFGFGE